MAKHKNIKFPDYPEFTPNLSPFDIFNMGSFGGTYFGPIYSKITKKNYKNTHLDYKMFDKIPENKLIIPYDEYDANINKYKVKVGTTLEFWESKKWITKYNPRGWVHWYCDFYCGRRCPDDDWQIKRWIKTAGPNSRFRKRLINMVHDANAKYNDFSVSPKIRQTLQHWGYILTKKDFKDN